MFNFYNLKKIKIIFDLVFIKLILLLFIFSFFFEKKNIKIETIQINFLSKNKFISKDYLVNILEKKDLLNSFLEIKNLSFIKKVNFFYNKFGDLKVEILEREPFLGFKVFDDYIFYDKEGVKFTNPNLDFFFQKNYKFFEIFLKEGVDYINDIDYNNLLITLVILEKKSIIFKQKTKIYFDGDNYVFLDCKNQISIFLKKKIKMN
jgi:hypothetical protein